MAVTAGTSKAATSVRKPTQVDTVRIGSSSACTGIILGAAADEIILDSAADSNFPYPGAVHQHVLYLRAVASTCEVYVSVDNSSYVLLSTVGSVGVVRTGTATELPYRYVKVKAVGGAVTLDVQSFPAVVR